TGNVNELDCCRHGPARPGKLHEHLQPCVRHGDYTEIRIDRAERVVRRLRFTRAGDSVEQRGFANVRQSYDSCAEHEPQMNTDSYTCQMQRSNLCFTCVN